MSRPKQPPHSQEAEMSVLGAIMLSPKAWQAVEGVVGADDFYRTDHTLIFATCAALWRADHVCDFITVTEALRKAGRLQDAGGASYIGSLVTETYSVANVRAYAEIVAKRARLRRIIALCADIGDAAYGLDDDDEVIAQLETGVERIGRRATSSALPFSRTLDLTEAAVREAMERRQQPGGVVGVPTGIQCLDERTGGLMPRRLIIVAARPGMGKTAMANQIAVHAGLHGYPGLVMSLEMGQEELGVRALANYARVNVTKLGFGFAEERERAIEAAAVLGAIPLWVDTDTYGLHQIVAQIAHFKREHGIRYAIVDHIGLVETERFNSRNDQLGAVTRALKKAAKRLDLPIVALSQLSREVEKAGRRPRLSDLRDSGNIEQDADICIFMHSESDDEMPVQRIELGLLKNRGGRKGWLSNNPLNFDGATQTFVETAP